MNCPECGNYLDSPESSCSNCHSKITPQNQIPHYDSAQAQELLNLISILDNFKKNLPEYGGGEPGISRPWKLAAEKLVEILKTYASFPVVVSDKTLYNECIQPGLNLELLINLHNMHITPDGADLFNKHLQELCNIMVYMDTINTNYALLSRRKIFFKEELNANSLPDDDINTMKKHENWGCLSEGMFRVKGCVLWVIFGFFLLISLGLLIAVFVADCSDEGKAQYFYWFIVATVITFFLGKGGYNTGKEVIRKEQRNKDLASLRRTKARLIQKWALDRHFRDKRDALETLKVAGFKNLSYLEG